MSHANRDFNRKWFVRGIGIFCGSLLGIALAVLGLTLSGDPGSTMVAVSLLSIGALLGGALGFWIPDGAELLLRIAIDFLRP